MIKPLKTADTTVVIKQEDDEVVKMREDYKADEGFPTDTSKEKEETINPGNMSQFATDWLQEVLDWRK